MIKRFADAFLGSLAAIWLSVILLSILGVLFLAAIVSSTFQQQATSLSFKDKTALYIKLDGTLTERPRPQDPLAELYGTNELTFAEKNIIDALAAAADDKKIKGVYIDCAGSQAGLAMRQEIVEAIAQFKDSGKWVIAYGDSYAQGDYYIATAADKMYLNPVGMVDVRGLCVTGLYFKNFLDKAGIEMQVVKVGTFKSAVEPFLLDHSSEANRLQQEHFLGNMWDTVASTIAVNRHVTVADVNMWADSLAFTFAPERLVELHVVDSLLYRRQVEDELLELCDLDEDDDLRLITPAEYCLIADIPHGERHKNRIAVLYAEGDIVDDGAGGIVGSEMVPLILSLKDNDKIDGLILRVNSGGGSAYASEQIWDALEQFKETGRPFYVSMSDYAASGGYYISCGAEQIYASPLTLTGSIGVFGTIPCINGLMEDKLGVNVDNVMTNANGNFPNIMTPMTPYQRASMQREVERTYELFTSRVAAGRNLPVDSVKAIAEGRVWDGTSALELGLVDKLGTLVDAIEAMAEELEFDGKYCVIDYPNPTPTLWEAIKGEELSARDKVMRSELGTLYPYYREWQRIKNLNGVQARMPMMQVQ